VEEVKWVWCLLSSSILAAPVGACEALIPKNPVKVAVVCGHVQSEVGDGLSAFELRLVRKDQTLVAESRTDAKGDFQFDSVAKGEYYLTAAMKGWWLGWPVRVTSTKPIKGCREPLTVQPSLIWGG